MFKEFKIDNLETFPQELENLLNKQRTQIDEITKNHETSYEKVLKPLQDMDEELGLFFTPLSHLNSVMNSDETQKAYEASIPLLSKFSSEIAQNVPLFHKMEKISAEDEEERTVVKNEVRDFILSGVKLPEEQKKRMEEISLQLSELSNTFSQNLLDATNAYELIIEDLCDHFYRTVRQVAYIAFKLFFHQCLGNEFSVKDPLHPSTNVYFNPLCAFVEHKITDLLHLLPQGEIIH